MRTKRADCGVAEHVRLLRAVAWSAIGAGGVVAWLLLPHGFPLLHPRFVVSELAPLALLVAGVIGVIAAARNRGLGLAFFAPLLATGALTAWCLRPPPPSTHPLGVTSHDGGEREVDCGKLRLHVDPTLRFPGRTGPTLTEPVYSHLNTFARIEVYRAKRLRVRFGAEPIDMPGEKHRFATWDGERLTAYEAGRAEKGPFRVLSSTLLDRGEPLVLELLDGEVPQCRVMLDDFTAQASTELSPTAGWGLPQNSIELLVSEEAPVQWIVVSLAATSVGIGIDPVGHAAGTYRNRIRIAQ